MLKAYGIQPDQNVWGKLNFIDAKHPLKLPGVVCPICGTWSTTGAIYPSFNASVLSDKLCSISSLPISIELFDELRLKVASLLGVEDNFVPGSEFGHLKGKAKGKFGDFAWLNPWTPLIRESVWLELREAGIELLGVRAELNFGKQKYEPFVEIEVHSGVKLISELILEEDRCRCCGRLPLKKGGEIIIDGSSFNNLVPIQRIYELPTILIVNDRLAKFIQQRNLRDVLLTQIEIK